MEGKGGKKGWGKAREGRVAPPPPIGESGSASVQVQVVLFT